MSDQLADIGVRFPLAYFTANVNSTIWLHTGQIGDEGWSRPDPTLIPASWAEAGPTADGLQNFVVAGPGLGSADANGDREALLDKIPGVQPQRTAEIDALVGQTVCAVVYDSDVSVNYEPLEASLKGANLGVVAFEVLATAPRSGSSLPRVQILIKDPVEACAELGVIDDPVIED